MTHTPLTTQQHDGIDELYRDDVREPLEAAGWHETAEDCVVAPNGALWTEMTPALDSGIDAPDKAWSVAFDSNVPAPIIVAAALAAAGTDVPALLADNQHLRQQLALATVLEIPRPGTVLPLQLRRSYGYADRWAICDREGRRWHREYGWVVQDDGLRYEAERDDSRYTLAEAVPLARRLADPGQQQPAARPVAASEDTGR